LQECLQDPSFHGEPCCRLAVAKASAAPARPRPQPVRIAFARCRERGQKIDAEHLMIDPYDVAGAFSGAHSAPLLHAVAS
jgi:hypothetical protein